MGVPARVGGSFAESETAVTDPAVEAAQRAWEKNKIHSFTVQRVNAAREALAPLRENWVGRGSQVALPDSETHLPGGRTVSSDCPNCDGRKCMGCIFREYDHDCADDCPVCCREGEPKG